ncbi:MAG: hypothetical protein L3J83_09500 [Proteobacteria bacterium]|nr:hypothetical protein [Pseudomonadota bacterium]
MVKELTPMFAIFIKVHHSTHSIHFDYFFTDIPTEKMIAAQNIMLEDEMGIIIMNKENHDAYIYDLKHRYKKDAQ